MSSNLYNEQMGNYFAKLAKVQTNISGTETAKQTNADRIRSMTDDELGEWLLKNAACPCAAMNGGCALNDDTCRQAWLSWLKEEVKNV